MSRVLHTFQNINDNYNEWLRKKHSFSNETVLSPCLVSCVNINNQNDRKTLWKSIRYARVNVFLFAPVLITFSRLKSYQYWKTLCCDYLLIKTAETMQRFIKHLRIQKEFWFKWIRKGESRFVIFSSLYISYTCSN